MKKILIFYGSFGGGHLSAAKALESELKNQGNVETKLIDSLMYVNRGFNKISTKFYSKLSKNSPWFWGKLYFSSEKGPLSKILYSSNSLMSSKLKKAIDEFKPDSIICTHPFSAQTCAHLKKHNKINAKISVVITDYEIHSQWYNKHKYIDNIFVASTKMKDDLLIKNIKSSKIHVTGIPVKSAFNKKYDKIEILKSLDFDPNKSTFMFFGGGELGLGKKLPVRTFESALHIYPDSQFIIISGKNDKLYNNFKKIIHKNNVEKSTKLIQFTDKIPEFMSISTAVFSKPGGLTTTEAITSELPIIIFEPLPGQEYANTSFVLEHDVGVFISNEDRIEDILSYLKDNPEAFNRMKKNMRKIKKPNAANDICNVVLQN